MDDVDLAHPAESSRLVSGRNARGAILYSVQLLVVRKLLSVLSNTDDERRLNRMERTIGALPGRK